MFFILYGICDNFLPNLFSFSKYIVIIGGDSKSMIG